MTDNHTLSETIVEVKQYEQAILGLQLNKNWKEDSELLLAISTLYEQWGNASGDINHHIAARDYGMLSKKISQKEAAQLSIEQAKYKITNNEYPEALAILHKIPHFHQHAAALLMLAQCEYQTQDYFSAIDTFQSYLELHSELATNDVHYQLALCYQQAEYYQEAIETIMTIRPPERNAKMIVLLKECNALLGNEEIKIIPIIESNNLNVLEKNEIKKLDQWAATLRSDIVQQPYIKQEPLSINERFTQIDSFINPFGNNYPRHLTITLNTKWQIENSKPVAIPNFKKVNNNIKPTLNYAAAAKKSITHPDPAINIQKSKTPDSIKQATQPNPLPSQPEPAYKKPSWSDIVSSKYVKNNDNKNVTNQQPNPVGISLIKIDIPKKPDIPTNHSAKKQAVWRVKKPQAVRKSEFSVPSVNNQNLEPALQTPLSFPVSWAKIVENNNIKPNLNDPAGKKSITNPHPEPVSNIQKSKIADSIKQAPQSNPLPSQQEQEKSYKKPSWSDIVSNKYVEKNAPPSLSMNNKKLEPALQTPQSLPVSWDKIAENKNNNLPIEKSFPVAISDGKSNIKIDILKSSLKSTMENHPSDDRDAKNVTTNAGRLWSDVVKTSTKPPVLNAFKSKHTQYKLTVLKNNYRQKPLSATDFVEPSNPIKSQAAQPSINLSSDNIVKKTNNVIINEQQSSDSDFPSAPSLITLSESDNTNTDVILDNNIPDFVCQITEEHDNYLDTISHPDRKNAYFDHVEDYLSFVNAFKWLQQNKFVELEKLPSVMRKYPIVLKEFSPYPYNPSTVPFNPYAKNEINKEYSKKISMMTFKELIVKHAAWECLDYINNPQSRKTNAKPKCW